MKIKDIVNRDLVNLTNCEHEPIHIPGSIQPHGFLLAFKKANRQIDFCSANIISFTGLRHDQVLSKRMHEVFGPAIDEQIIAYVKSKSPRFAPPLAVVFNGMPYTLSTHDSNDVTILEFEPAAEEPSPHVIEFYDQTREFVVYMEKTTSLHNLCQRVAEHTRSITGYDRVMIYRFDKNYNGEVYAESKRDDLEPFLGLHYPHTDIPAQARELYKQNLLRLIVDVAYTPVPLYTIDDVPGKNLNLGNAVLRSVSPIHVQYLANIGVGATLTISIMHKNDLWGLIACHHYSPKYINNFIRNTAQLQGHFITSQIDVRQAAERHVMAVNIASKVEKMHSLALPLNRDMFKIIVQHDELLELCNASGVAIFVEENIYVNGVVPNEKDIRSIVNAVTSRTAVGSLHTNRLTDIYAAAENLRDCAAGVLFHLRDDVFNVGIIWFRGETLLEVKWAGDPNKAIVKDEKGLSPRKSFELWKEEIKLQSSEWTEPELSAAANFAHSLERQAHLLFLSEEEKKYRILNEVLKETNAELENINWISTHDLKEPLRKIKLFGSRILETHGDQLNASVIESIKKMNNAASRMQTLIADLLAYSRIRQNQEKRIDTDLTAVLMDVLKQVQEENDHAVKIQYTPLPVIKGISFLLHQLFLNIINNSIKFAKKDLAPVISIQLTQKIRHSNTSGVSKGTYYEIVMKDNGIGFDAQFNESIFEVFTRLHNHEEYNGTGIGLALCKKIMQIHNGFIRANGTEGEGAEFTIGFPVAQD